MTANGNGSASTAALVDVLAALVREQAAAGVAAALDQVREVVRREIAAAPRAWESPFLSIVEVADLLRCKRARVDDLLSRGRLSRAKDGARTLIARAEVLDYLAGRPTGPGRWAGQVDVDRLLAARERVA